MTEPPSRHALVALVDRLILEQGRLDPLELLLAGDCLAYADYEAWRLGGAARLQDLLRVPPDAAVALLTEAARHAAAQRLVPTPLRHRGWGACDATLDIGPHPGLARACANLLRPAADRVQLDLFQDSTDLLLEEALCDALAERRGDAALAAFGRLRELAPRHPRLPRFERLMLQLDALPGLAPATRLDGLEALTPAAQELLGHRSRDLLVPLWASLAEALAGQAFDPDRPRLHAAHAWARAGRYAQARAALEAVPDWRRWPALLIAHAEASQRSGDRAAARRDWALLCWGHPAAAARALDEQHQSAPELGRLWRQFADADLDLATADFPAWLLVADPWSVGAVPPDLVLGEASGVTSDQDSVGRALETYRLLHRLVQGEDTIPLRKALVERSPGLLTLYLASLAGRSGR